VKNQREKQEWILDFLEKRKTTPYAQINVLDKYFVVEYIEKFNPDKVAYYFYGAPKCPEIGKLLSIMYNCNLLKRYRVGLSNMESGFPKWVYCYELRY